MYYREWIISGRRRLGRLASFAAGLGRRSGQRIRRVSRPWVGSSSSPLGIGDTGDASVQVVEELLADAYVPVSAPARLRLGLRHRLVSSHRSALGAMDSGTGLPTADGPVHRQAGDRHWSRLQPADTWRHILRPTPGQADLLLRGGAVVGALSVVGLVWLGRSGRPL